MSVVDNPLAALVLLADALICWPISANS
eukprot:COSAG03_NODE_19041_length_343_cov_1.274590_1_plen_27_part_01